MSYRSLYFSLLSLFLVVPLSIGQRNDNHRIAEDTRSVGQFEGVKVGSGIDLIIKQEPGSNQVVVKADEQQIDHIKTEVVNDILVIKLEKGTWVSWKWRKMEVYVTTSHLRSLNAHGGSDVKVEGKLEVSELKIKAQGGSDVELNLDAESLMCTISGASDIELSGRVQDFTCASSGASDLKADDLQVQNCILTVQGASDARIYVNGDLSVEVAGASDVRVSGDPNIVHKKVSGVSDLKIDRG